MTRTYLLKFLVFLLVGLVAGCGYHVRADGEPVGITIQNLAIPLFTSTSSEMGFEALFTRVIREEFISHSKVLLVPEDRARMVLIGRIYDISADPIGFDSTTGFTVTSTRRIRVKLDVQMVDKAQGKIIWHDKALEERTSYSVGADPLTAQMEEKQALETLAQRVAKKIYQRTVERF
jgi:outer membrane lipopolysaccharide assembly protein LptE/RlpB